MTDFNKRTVNGNVTVTVPAGTYWVGDPCYSCPSGDGSSEDWWLTWLNDTGWDHPILAADVNGYPVVGVGTAFGDGAYDDQYGFEYGVDAGLIGVVPVEVAMQGTENDKDHTQYGWEYDEQGNLPGMYQKVTFDKPFEISYQEDGGIIRIGHLEIPTGWDDDDDDDDEWAEDAEDNGDED